MINYSKQKNKSTRQFFQLLQKEFITSLKNQAYPKTASSSFIPFLSERNKLGKLITEESTQQSLNTESKPKPQLNNSQTPQKFNSIILFKQTSPKDKLFFLQNGLKKQSKFLEFLKSSSERNLFQEKNKTEGSNKQNFDTNFNQCTKTENSVNLNQLYSKEEKTIKNKLLINTKFLSYKDPLHFNEIQFKTPSKQQQYHIYQVPPVGYYDVSDKVIKKNVPTFKLQYSMHDLKINKMNQTNNNKTQLNESNNYNINEKQEKKIVLPKIRCKLNQFKNEKEIYKKRFSPSPLKNFTNFPVQQFEAQLNQQKMKAKEVALNLAKWGKNQDL